MSLKNKKYPNIEAERARNGITLEKLSNLLGISRKTFYNWIYKGNIPQDKLETMANLFGVSTDYLLKTPKINPQ